MKKLFLIISIILSCRVMAQDIDALNVNIEDVAIVSFYRNSVNNNITKDYIETINNGQEPSFILSKLPSIFAYSDTGNEYGYSYFRMRGMDQTRVNMTLDGMPLAEGEDMGVYFSNFPDLLSSMHSINVDNGASISNNGTAAYAGSINFESVDLIKDTLSYAQFGLGSFNTYKTNIQYNSGKIGKFAFHINVNNQQSDGYKYNAYNNSQSAFVKIGYFINDNHSLDILSFAGHSRNSQGWIGTSLDDLNIDPRINGCTDKETDKFVQNITKLQYKGIFGNTILTSSVYYNHLNGYYNFDLDNYMWKFIDSSCDYTGEIDKYSLKHHMFGSNIVAKTYFNNLNLVYGINASRFWRNHVGTYNLANDILWDNTGYKTDINTFVTANYYINNFKLSGNVQYRHADFDYSGDIDFSKINWDFFNWNARVDYSINNHNNIYASITQTHREPTRSDMFGGEENFVELYTTQAESVIDYEIGYTINYNKFSGNVNFYYMDFDNELILNGEYGSNGLPIRVNEANSVRYGVELILEYNPCNFISLINKSSFSKNNVTDETKTYNHVMSPSAIITQDVIFNINKNLNIDLSYSYRDKMYINLLNNYILDSSNKFNLGLNYSIKNVNITAKVNNIFNSTTYSNGMIGLNGPLYFIDVPRNFFVNVKFAF